MEEMTLRGRIISMYETLGKFAKAIGFSRRKVSDIVNKRQEPTASDIEVMADALKVELPAEFRILFLN